MNKLMLFDFQCDSCKVTEEKMVTTNVHDYKCGYCTGQMRRIISGTSFRLDGTDPGYPTAWDKWAKQHEKAGGQD